MAIPGKGSRARPHLADWTASREEPMSVYSLAHVLDVQGWPTVWGIEAQRSESGAPEADTRADEMFVISAQLASISAQLRRLQR
jgi:hypothetical protein